MDIKKWMPWNWFKKEEDIHLELVDDMLTIRGKKKQEKNGTITGLNDPTAPFNVFCHCPEMWTRRISKPNSSGEY